MRFVESPPCRSALQVPGGCICAGPCTFQHQCIQRSIGAVLLHHIAIPPRCAKLGQVHNGMGEVNPDGVRPVPHDYDLDLHQTYLVLPGFAPKNVCPPRLLLFRPWHCPDPPLHCAPASGSFCGGEDGSATPQERLTPPPTKELSAALSNTTAHRTAPLRYTGPMVDF